MATITTQYRTAIFYKDWGSGQPIVFSHGWPLSADDRHAQLLFFLHHGWSGLRGQSRWDSRINMPNASAVDISRLFC